MSDTQGWKFSKRKVMYKRIGDTHYEISETEPNGGLWCVKAIKDGLVPAYRLADAKRAAHRHAEEQQ